MSNHIKITPSLFARLNRLIFISISFICPLAQSEVTLDGSVGPAAALKGPDFQITENLGTRAGNNLFHSFGRFNLNQSQSATFSGSAGINNVIGRVTGGQASTIDGTLRVSIPNANLYLLNPAGVIFGENATLDVPGSFHASTANYLTLQDGVRFDSGTATKPQVLTTAAPEAFGFLGENPAGILLTGTTDSVLEVQQGSTISLIGGDITSESTAIYAPGGQINLASVGSAGEVIVNNSEIQTTPFKQMGNIRLSQDPLIPRTPIESGGVVGNVDVSSDTAGKVSIRGGQLVMDNSFIASETKTGNGGGISIKLTNDLSISAPKSSNPELATASGITSFTKGKGNAGNIKLDVVGLKLADRTKIDTRARNASTGNAGDLTINANSIQLKDVDPDIDTQLTTASKGDGNAGNITIISDKLELQGSSLIDSSTYDNGKGGDLNIKTDDLKILNSGNILNLTGAAGNGGTLKINANNILLSGNNTAINSSAFGSGDSGNLTIISEKLELSNGAQIMSSSLSQGNNGDIFVNSSEIILLNDERALGDLEPNKLATGIHAGLLGDSATGNSGNLTIKSDRLIVNNGALISANNSGQGNGSNILVDSNEIVLTNDKTALDNFTPSEFLTGIHANLLGDSATGNSGNLTIKSSNLMVSNGAKVSANNSGQGNSGDLFVESNKILLTNDANALSDFNPIELGTGIQASLIGNSATGNSGHLTIKSNNLLVSNGASVTANNISGKGNSGDLFVESNKILLTNDENVLSDFNPIELGTGIQADLLGNNVTGDSGTLTIKSNNLIAKNGASVTASNFGQSKSGDLFVESNEILLTNDPDVDVKNNLGGIKANIGPSSNGDSGGLTVKANNLVVLNEASINTNNFGTGTSGNLIVDAESIILSGNGTGKTTGITNNAHSTGRLGELTVTADSLKIQKGATISAVNFGILDALGSDGGNININSNLIILSGDGTPFFTGITAQTQTTGDAGDITVTADTIEMQSNAEINAITQSSGRGGNIVIDAENITLSEKETSISTQTQSDKTDSDSTGAAGDITILTRHLNVHDNAVIDTTTDGNGESGDININASKIELHEKSHVSATTTGRGSAGDVTLVADDIFVSDKSTIQSGSLLDDLANSNNLDLGKSGAIDITFNDTLRLDDSKILTLSTNTSGGNITINNGNLMQLRNDSFVSARVRNDQGKGGNILINTPIVALDNSTISAQAAEGQGGNINISGFLFQSPNSLVTASSELGVDGEINLQPVTNISASIAVLPDTLMDTSQHLSERCVARSENNMSSFVVKGRGVLPITPDDMAPSKYLNDLQTEENLLQDNEGKGDTNHHSLDNTNNSLYSSLEKEYQSETMNNDCNP
jgi:filamentous hemagglutinin family protein